MSEENKTETSSFGNRVGVNRGNSSSDNSNKDGKNNSFGYKRGADRPQIVASSEQDIYWGAEISSNILSKNQLRSNISEVLKGIFNDYTGCNIFMDPTCGQFKLVAFFGPQGLNPDAPYKAFDQDLEGKLKSSQHPLQIIATSNAGRGIGKIYHPTRDGHGLLSDFVPATPYQKDKDGWVTKFQNFYTEVSNTPQMYNGYYMSYFVPNSQEFVWAAVQLDVANVLRLCKDRINKKDKNAHHYDYLIMATNTMIMPTMQITSYAAQEVDFMVEIKEVDSTEMTKMLAQTGAGGSAGMMANPFVTQYGGGPIMG